MSLVRRLLSLHLRLYSPIKRARKLGVKLGKNCIIARSVNFGSEPYLVSIGDNFYSSENISFLTHDGSINVLRNLYEGFKGGDIFGPIRVGNNVFLGHGVTVLPGAVIQDNVIVGASSLVRGTLSADSVYAGIPARWICSLDSYVQKRASEVLPTKALSAQEKRQYLAAWLRRNHPGF